MTEALVVVALVAAMALGCVVALLILGFLMRAVLVRALGW